MNENMQSSFYQTGSTQPPKKHGGWLALVVVVFIFLSGIVSVLGLLNIRLFRKAEEAARENPISFSRQPESTVQSAAYTEQLHLPDLGICGGFTDPLDQLLYSLPQGFYISAVDSGSNAEQKGLIPGDVIQSLDGTVADSLQALLDGLQEKQTVRLIVNRNGHQFYLDIAVTPNK